MWTVRRVVPGSQPWTKCSTGPRSRVRSERRDTEAGDVPPLGWRRGAAMTLVVRHGVGSSILPNGRPLAPESGTLIFFPPHPLNLLCYWARATVPKSQIPNPLDRVTWATEIHPSRFQGLGVQDQGTTASVPRERAFVASRQPPPAVSSRGGDRESARPLIPLLMA